MLKVEMIITGALISMPIMVPFYQSIGMDQGQIGLSQAFFTIAILMVNIPTGWIADRFSRKWCNAIGDLGCAISLLIYSTVQSFSGVVMCEIIFGVTRAFSQGADSGLLKAYTDKLDPSGKMLQKQYASTSVWAQVAQIIALAIGGVVGPYNFRLAIAISAIPLLIGGILSIFIKEEGERLVSQHKNPLRDMLRVTRENVGGNRKLRWRIIGLAVSSQITHPIIWALTPLLMLAGVPLKIVALGWILNAASIMVGSLIAKRWSIELSTLKKFLIPTATIIAALLIMSIILSIGTIWLYSFIGMAQGWIASTMLASVQELASNSCQATIVSIAKSVSQILYIPLVWIIGLVGNIDIRLMMVATIIIFVPLVTLTAIKLRNLEKE